ncbi:type VI secretion system tube protein Hcp [Bacteroidales bacterium OttesenSCG-928-B11]|nr:type VI secretion system tube protein Hcp [Bacteroidales bacterium OttesenSCG-928-E04]MDL2312433.1 type VI secretion system tube protein Hcp [Bacteroidales bacterium OttesenSCG-928-B11]
MRKITKNNSCGNMAGYKRLFAAPVSEIESIDFIDVKTKIVSLKRDFAFGEIQADSIEVDSPFKDGCYEHGISCRFTAMKNSHDSLFDKMTRQRFIVKVVDNNNMVWLAGTLSEPLLFSWGHIGKAFANGEHLYELTFRRASTEPLYTTTL